MKTLLSLLTVLLPWPLRRLVLQRCFGFVLHPTARLGLAWVFPRHLIMEAGSSIGALTVGRHLDLIHLRAHAQIGRGNWITGFPGGDSRHFTHQVGRRSELHLGEHAAITNRHLIDCTSPVTIGAFTTMAGFHSQILTHTIELDECRQTSAPVTVGAYCFIGTNCVLLGGAALPARAVLGAKSLLNKAFEEELTLYGGVPARRLKALSPAARYFTRQTGFVF